MKLAFLKLFLGIYSSFLFTESFAQADSSDLAESSISSISSNLSISQAESQNSSLAEQSSAITLTIDPDTSAYLNSLYNNATNYVERAPLLKNLQHLYLKYGHTWLALKQIDILIGLKKYRSAKTLLDQINLPNFCNARLSYLKSRYWTPDHLGRTNQDSMVFHINKAIRCSPYHGDFLVQKWRASLFSLDTLGMRIANQRLFTQNFFSRTSLKFAKTLLQNLPDSTILISNLDALFYSMRHLQLNQNIRQDIKIIPWEVLISRRHLNFFLEQAHIRAKIPADEWKKIIVPLPEYTGQRIYYREFFNELIKSQQGPSVIRPIALTTLIDQQKLFPDSLSPQNKWTWQGFYLKWDPINQKVHLPELVRTIRKTSTAGTENSFVNSSSWHPKWESSRHHSHSGWTSIIEKIHLEIALRWIKAGKLHTCKRYLRWSLGQIPKSPQFNPQEYLNHCQIKELD